MAVTFHSDGRIMHGGINVAPKPMIDTYHINSQLNSAQTPVTAWSRLTSSGFLNTGPFNSGMSLSSGVFTFPTTGRYLIIWTIGFYFTGNDAGAGFNLQTCTDGSTFSSITNLDAGDGGGHHDVCAHQFVVTITDTSNQKVRFASASMTAAYIKGNTTQSYGSCTFIRLSDS